MEKYNASAIPAPAVELVKTDLNRGGWYGILYIVATPIGNLKDITLRAIETLKNVDLIAAEDTRHTKNLLTHYNIQKPLTSYFEHNQVKKTDYIIDELKHGKSVALVSDAGTPGISDPGFVVIRQAIKEGIKVEAIPGPSALICGLVLSGLPTDRFVFEGFLPPKGAARRKKLEALKEEQRTIIFYESPHRVLKTLADIADILPDASLACVREATKMFEETIRGTAQEVLAHFKPENTRGEFVLILSNKA